RDGCGGHRTAPVGDVPRSGEDPPRDPAGAVVPKARSPGLGWPSFRRDHRPKLTASQDREVKVDRAKRQTRREAGTQSLRTHRVSGVTETRMSSEEPSEDR